MLPLLRPRPFPPLMLLIVLHQTPLFHPSPAACPHGSSCLAVPTSPGQVTNRASTSCVQPGSSLGLDGKPSPPIPTLRRKRTCRGRRDGARVISLSSPSLLVCAISSRTLYSSCTTPLCIFLLLPVFLVSEKWLCSCGSGPFIVDTFMAAVVVATL